MSAVNAALAEVLRARDVDVNELNTASPSIDRTIKSVFVRALRFARVVIRVATLQRATSAVHVSVSGGLGQLFEVAVALHVRMRGLTLVLHHHSYAYATAFSRVTWLLTRVAGNRAIHVVLCPDHGARLSALYAIPEQNLQILDNSLFVSNGVSNRSTRFGLKHVGFLSNLLWSKGVDTYLDVVGRVRHRGFDVVGIIAGGHADAAVSELLSKLPEGGTIEQRGPVYGSAKDAFFDDIDVLLFPTRYANETAPMVIYEAMARGIPVLATDRGCIREMVASADRLTANSEFPDFASEQIASWCADDAMFARAQREAAAVFDRHLETARGQLLELIDRYGKRA